MGGDARERMHESGCGSGFSGADTTLAHLIGSDKSHDLESTPASAPYPLPIRSLSAPYPLPIRSRAMWPVLANGSSRASALSWKSNFRQQ